MLATLVIGLREGLEAALIVSIIAAFLRRNGKSLTAMWLGVTLAVLLSIGVGVSLDLIERGLPQARQEGMESVIGAIAIFFVTGMIVWMNAHARDIKRQLEAEAAQALSQTRAYALASMAFLAVLKEGFETSVFLLATFSAAQSAAWAASGALLGLLLAVLIGWGIYVGGVKVDLSKFFRLTGAFLILVAAGLVITSLRTAHEAGWLNVGQQTTVNLAWLVAPGTIQSALLTGVLGIPADPRLIEVVGWLAYLVPVALFLYSPRALRPAPRAAMRLQLATAVVIGVAAVALFAFSSSSHLRSPAQAPLVTTVDGALEPVGTARLTVSPDHRPTLLVSLKGAGENIMALPLEHRTRAQHAGIDASAWTLTRTGVPLHAPSTLTLDRIVALLGGRIPPGLNPREHPGPFDAAWSTRRLINVWTADDVLLDVVEQDRTIVTLSGGGLRTPRTITVSAAGAPASSVGWTESAAYRTKVTAELRRIAEVRVNEKFWGSELPIALLAAALMLATTGWRARLRLGRDTSAPPIAQRPSRATLNEAARAN
ncbi:MAG: iron uptake transporter permease EfeU [Steroidobacteraceae bacterium]